MLTVFERIPDLFVQMYDAQFQMWARQFRARGKRCAIVFDRRPGEAVLLDGEGRPVLKGAWLEAEVDRSVPERPRVVIRPWREQDEELIRRHCREMSGHVLQ